MARTKVQVDNPNRRAFINNSIWASVIPTIASVLGPSGAVIASTQAHNDIHVRKNIEDIDPADYIHALNKLRERADDPINADNFFYYAWVHNTDDPPCEHNSHIFFPWHRALLYFFEQALQNVDPPRTKNVTLPYYDYTTLPKDPGKRYPNAFEDPTSVLAEEWFTNWRPTTRRTGPIDEPFYSYTEDVVQLIERNKNWSSSNLENGGSINGFGGRPKGDGGGKGAVESPQHDWMHSRWMDGLLGNPSTAAFDPIFWSFHAFEDLMFDLWIQKWGADNIDGEDVELRNMPETCHVRDVLDTKNLGYEYDFTPPPGLEGVVTSLGVLGSFAQRRPQIAREAGVDDTQILQTYELQIPTPGIKIAPLVVRDFEISNTTNYHGYIYLHPKNVEVDTKSALFREKYLVDYFAVLSMQMDGMKTDLSFDLTAEFKRLSQLYPGKNWLITIVAAIDDGPAPEGVEPSAPSIGAVELNINR